MIDTAQDIPTYKKRLKKALENDFLRNALSAFATAYPQARKKALEGIDFEAIRDEIAAGKDESMARLEELFQEFKDRAEKKRRQGPSGQDRQGSQRNHRAYRE